MKMELNKEMQQNLLVFLNRVDLKGSEVDAFIQIRNAIVRAGHNVIQPVAEGEGLKSLGE